MSKIITIKSCSECQYTNEHEDFCTEAEKVICNSYITPDWCPLPETKLNQQMQWISVSERLPERPLYDWVLVATKLVPENWYGVPRIAELRNGVWYSNSYNAPFESTCGIVVTHWMPLPKLPNDGDNNECN